MAGICKPCSLGGAGIANANHWTSCNIVSFQGFIDVTYMSSKPDGLRLSRGNKVKHQLGRPETQSPHWAPCCLAMPHAPHL